MSRKRTAAERGDMNIDAADRLSREPPGQVDVSWNREHALLHLAPVRVVPLPEPVDTGWVGWRPPGGFATAWEFCQYPPVGGGWEVAALTEVRMRERAAELVLLGGLT